MCVGGGENVGEWAVLVTEEGSWNWGGGSEVTMGCCGGPMADSGRGYAKLAGPLNMRWPNAPAWKEAE